MPLNINPSNDNNQSVLLAQLLSTSKFHLNYVFSFFFLQFRHENCVFLVDNMFSTQSSSGASVNMAKFRSINGSYQSYQQVPQIQQVQQIPYQLIQRRARTPDHVLTSYTDHLVYRKPSPVFMNQR